MKWAREWELVHANRTLQHIRFWPSAPATIHVAACNHVPCHPRRTFSHGTLRLDKSLPATTIALQDCYNDPPAANCVEGVAKQLDRTPKAFKQSLRRLRRKNKIVESHHPGTSFESSRPPGFRKMKSYIQFLTTPTVDTPGTALLLHFDEKRYLIGHIHEGLQRAGIQFGTKFAKVTDIFLTGKTEWSTTGGLFGLILTLADAATESTKVAIEASKQKKARRHQQLSQGHTLSATDMGLATKPWSDISKPTLNVHGGPNLNHSVATARRFIFRKSMPVNVLEHEEKSDEADNINRRPDWVDDHIQAWTLAISPTTGGGSASQSPNSRKRNHAEYAETVSPTNLFGDDPSASDKARTDQDLRKHVVSEMFNSSWRLDELEERPLSEVNDNTQMFIRNRETNKLERYKPPPRDDRTLASDITVLTRKAWPGANIVGLPACKPSSVALSYIIRNHRQRGKFLPWKAKELNVKPGPLWSQLTCGESVQASDGKTVTPDMVLAEGKEGGGIAVVDLPSTKYVENLIRRPEWQDKNIMTGVGAILWLLGAGVAKDSRLQEFMSKNKTLEHIISSPDHCSNNLTFSSAASSAIRLSQIHPRYYPIPVHNNSPSVQVDAQECTVAVAHRGQKFQLEPTFEKQDDAIVPLLDTAAVLQNTPKDVLQLARDARGQIDQAKIAKRPGQRLPSEDAEITFLGTGSALPSKYRNVAGTLLRVPGCGSYLLDCGENTLGQLKRVYGPEMMKEVLRDLKLIWISHLHADHHLGLASVIKAWYQEVHGASNKPSTSSPSVLDEFMDLSKVLCEKDRLCVAGTGLMMTWLKEYASVEDYGYSKIVPLASITTANNQSFLECHGKRFNWNANNPE
jgi:ribonuclease Z